MRIPLKELFSTSEEVHAYLIGISQGFFFFQKHPPLIKEIEGERHYYEQGKILGFIFFGVFMACLGWLIINLWF